MGFGSSIKGRYTCWGLSVCVDFSSVPVRVDLKRQVLVLISHVVQVDDVVEKVDTLVEPIVDELEGGEGEVTRQGKDSKETI